MPYKYSFKDYEKENMAKAVGNDLSISTKIAIEICNWLRKKKLDKAKQMLNDVIEMKIPVPIKRFMGDRGHKPGMAAGRYPVKAAKEILRMLVNAEGNAQFKGINTSNLILTHIKANQSARPMHYGRQGGTQMKRTHIEIVLTEAK